MISEEEFDQCQYCGGRIDKEKDFFAETEEGNKKIVIYKCRCCGQNNRVVVAKKVNTRDIYAQNVPKVVNLTAVCDGEEVVLGCGTLIGNGFILSSFKAITNMKYLTGQLNAYNNQLEEDVDDVQLAYFEKGSNLILLSSDKLKSIEGVTFKMDELEVGQIVMAISTLVKNGAMMSEVNNVSITRIDDTNGNTHYGVSRVDGARHMGGLLVNADGYAVGVLDMYNENVYGMTYAATSANIHDFLLNAANNQDYDINMEIFK